MLLKRNISGLRKEILVINDVPVKKEIDSGIIFSSISNVNLLESLRTGKLRSDSQKTLINHQGIPPLRIKPTYLCYSYYFEENNYDFIEDFKKRKDLELVEDKLYFGETEFHLLPHQKDLYLSERLWNEFQALIEEIQYHNPKLIIITGKWTLFLLTACTTFGQNVSTNSTPKPLGCILKFRSSILEPWVGFDLGETLIYPIIHPVNIFSMQDKTPYIQLDIEKAGKVYHNIKTHGVEYYSLDTIDYKIATDISLFRKYKEEILEKLANAPILVSIDIETISMKYIDCIGLAFEESAGFCFPLATAENPNYWEISEEIEVLLGLKEILEHKNLIPIGQNFNYDCQWFYRHWGIPVIPAYDTMGIQHTLYSFTPKNLAFLASIYVEKYRHWKDEGAISFQSPLERWKYNIKDVIYTLQILKNQLELLKLPGNEKLYKLYLYRQQEVNPIFLYRTIRGVLIDVEAKQVYYTQFSEILFEIKQTLNEILGFEFNPESTPQKKKLFKEFFGIKLKQKRVKGKESRETCDAAAMLEYIQEYPEYYPFLRLMLEYNAVKIILRNFLGMVLDDYGYGHTSYNVFGPYTGRFSSSKDAFGMGSNFQNIPEKGKLELEVIQQLVESPEIELEDSEN